MSWRVRCAARADCECELLDDGLPRDWPTEVKAASAALRQGDVLDLRPLFYLTDTANPIWLLSHQLARQQEEDGEAPGLIVGDLAPGAPLSPLHAIVTSQSCDIGEEGEVWQFPWLQVAPVYQTREQQLLQRDYIVPLTADEFTLGGTTFYADLRLELPIEKGTVVGVRARPGFATEEEGIRFAETLGRRRQRAALPTRVNTHIRGSMRDHVQANRAAWRRIRDAVHKIMLAIDVGTRADPRVVRVFVVSTAPLSDQAKQWFEAWQAQARDAAAEAGLTLAPIGYMDPSDFDVRRYDALIEINKNF